MHACSMHAKAVCSSGAGIYIYACVLRCRFVRRAAIGAVARLELPPLQAIELTSLLALSLLAYILTRLLTDLVAYLAY